jgi:hypothetical protein
MRRDDSRQVDMDNRQDAIGSHHFFITDVSGIDRGGILLYVRKKHRKVDRMAL